MQTKEYTTEVGGKTLTATFTDLTDQADGSVILRYGDTVVLATAVMSEKTREGLDYFPLSVEYEEKFYAAGQILGSRFMRREGRPSDEAVLSGRAVDRTIRPLFDHRERRDVQVVITILSLGAYDPDMLAINAASIALATSDIPWGGPISAIRMGKHKNGDGWKVNPTYEFRGDDDNEGGLLVCGKDQLVTMIEAGVKEASEASIVDGLKEAQKEIEELQRFQDKIIKEIGKEKRAVEPIEPTEELVALYEETIAQTLDEKLFIGKPGKGAIQKINEEWMDIVKERLPEEDRNQAIALLDRKIDEAVHRGALERDQRVDGRKFDEVRPLFAKAGGISSVLHGSGIFYRGGTHILSALTLGGPQDSLIVDGMEQQGKKRFMHHYNFPPFSVGETGRVGGFNRRMIGHGALAEKAIEPVLPSVELFPYTVRIVSEALASNGSTSMGSVCGSTIALMDAGVPISRPVAGIAMGLMSDGKTYKVLTDIQGPEDHHGDMDLKVAGTSEGITALQMDVKVTGVPMSVLEEAFVSAKTAREQILGVITKEISEPRSELSPNAPRILSMKINPDQIGLVIGSGGKTVNTIKELTGSEVDIEEDGTVFFTGTGDGPEKARALVEQLTHEYKAGDKFTGEVTRIMDFGAFVRLGEASPLGEKHDAEGLVHISEIAPFRINKVDDVVKVGEEVPVVVKEIDEQGRINLSIKAADPDFAKNKGIKPAAPSPQHGTGSGEHKRDSRPRRY